MKEGTYLPPDFLVPAAETLALTLAAAAFAAAQKCS